MTLIFLTHTEGLPSVSLTSCRSQLHDIAPTNFKPRPYDPPKDFDACCPGFYWPLLISI